MSAITKQENAHPEAGDFNAGKFKSVLPNVYQMCNQREKNIFKKWQLYRPVALTSIAMKCFERLDMAHINTIIPETLNPLQFAFYTNRSIDDAIYIALHTASSHLDKRNTYSWIRKFIYTLAKYI